MEKISTNKAPKAIGPYSQAILLNGMVYTSGQIALDPEQGVIVGDEIKSQTERVMKNLQAVLEEAGTSFDKVVKTTCFIANINGINFFLLQSSLDMCQTTKSGTPSTKFIL